MACCSYRLICLLLVLMMVMALPNGAAAARKGSDYWDPFIRSPVDLEDDELGNGTRWALLVAGSKGYQSYRHQVS
ncbi:putative legumain protein [Helianthus annuus]|nr:putative legumain protein [Helianthus annuus]